MAFKARRRSIKVLIPQEKSGTKQQTCKKEQKRLVHRGPIQQIYFLEKLLR
jgi:hypothetical protein